MRPVHPANESALPGLCAAVPHHLQQPWCVHAQLLPAAASASRGERNRLRCCLRRCFLPGGALGLHLRHGEGPRELPVLLQDRLLPVRACVAVRCAACIALGLQLCCRVSARAVGLRSRRPARRRRHGDRCSRLHNKPTISQTLLMPNMYQSPATIMTPTGPAVTDPRQLQEHFEVRGCCARRQARADALRRTFTRTSSRSWTSLGRLRT